MADEPLSIAVIGGGPSGLFFCHAIEYYLKKELQEPKSSAQREVKVVCFEKSSQPGGVWRAASDRSSIDATEMYDKLWTNGASHLTEFFDYTYDEHFGRPVSVYMKRQDLLDYILGRVTKNCPDFLEKYVEFQKQVEHVVYDDDSNRFNVSVRDLNSSVTTLRHFDKCIWACGENGRRNFPLKLVSLLRDGGFRGRIIHSAETATLEEDVKGKRILIVGGGFSGEDLALQTIKLGVEKIYVCTRNNATEICWTKHWPMNKVKLLRCQEPLAVTENGRCIQFMEVGWTPYGYVRYGDEVESEVRNIDTIILCTGYHTNLEMLDPSLRQGFPKAESLVEETYKVPDGWTMPPNVLTKYTGEVEVSDQVRYYPCYVHPNFYRGVLISNPNMMFITTYGAHDPLLACEAYSWLLAGYATGHVDMPSPERMREMNLNEALDLFKLPYFRYLTDDNYWKKVDNLENFWSDDPEVRSPVWDEVEYEEYIQATKMLARVMQEAKYPWSIGTYEELNENGKELIRLGDLAYEHRANLKPVGDEKDWRTFRDVDNAGEFASLFTGTKAVPLDGRWMDMDNDDESLRDATNKQNEASSAERDAK
jgi:thioredoxin reductase